MNAEERTTIGPQSKVSLALLGAIFLAIVGATWGAARWAAKVDARLANIEKELTIAAEVRKWVDRLREANPDLRVPSFFQ